ncbi:hypothetical protein ACJX0J_036043, partial [Zea mays]
MLDIIENELHTNMFFDLGFRCSGLGVFGDITDSLVKHVVFGDYSRKHKIREKFKILILHLLCLYALWLNG